ncbi:MAG TPA: response regulator, partial [Hellea balneolensis]|nr:response regulator [Hellea balneolensis]
MNKNVETTVLLADDDASIRLVVAKFLSNQGYVVRATDNVHTLLRWLQQGEGDVVVSDVHMGVDNVFSFIPKIKQLRPDIPIIIISANTSVITALKSKKSKVFEYIPKPFDLENISDTITRATLNTGQEQPARFKAVSQIMVGKSQIMQP